MEVITLQHLSHLPKNCAYLMVGMVADEIQARVIGEKYGAKAVYYWPKTKSAYILIEKKEEKDGYKTV